jgi:hypothetical protein
VYTLGGWFQYGVIEGESRYGLDFTNGPGYSLHFRYNVSRKAAIVFYFDNQRYEATGDSIPGGGTPPDKLTLTNAHAGVRFFSIPQGDVIRYLEVTGGFYRPEIEFLRTQQSSIGTEICFPGEGFLMHAGAGVEIFFTSAWALELGLHGYGLFGKGLCRTDVERGEKEFSGSGQVVVGVDYFLFR